MRHLNPVPEHTRYVEDEDGEFFPPAVIPGVKMSQTSMGVHRNPLRDWRRRVALIALPTLLIEDRVWVERWIGKAVALEHVVVGAGQEEAPSARGGLRKQIR